jgi:hypothetical protein
MERADPELLELVELVRSFEYGRPSDRSVEAMLRERRGTCSAKHRFLARRLDEDFPDLEPRIVHRVYRVDRERARRDFGDRAAAVVPPEGLVDVHRYLTIELNGRRAIIDATFPGPPWDGRSDLPLACGPGVDHPSEGDPDREKRALEERYCDPVLRDQFIEALS